MALPRLHNLAANTRDNLRPIYGAGDPACIRRQKRNKLAMRDPLGTPYRRANFLPLLQQQD
jgi:hypothetical protein